MDEMTNEEILEIFRGYFDEEEDEERVFIAIPDKLARAYAVYAQLRYILDESMAEYKIDIRKSEHSPIVSPKLYIEIITGSFFTGRNMEVFRNVVKEVDSVEVSSVISPEITRKIGLRAEDNIVSIIVSIEDAFREIVEDIT